MKITILLMLLTSCMNVLARDGIIDSTAILECRYVIQETDDTLKNDHYSEDRGLLRVGATSSMFYNMKMYYVDSLCSTPGGNRLWGQMMVQAIRSRRYNALPKAYTSVCEYVYKNWPEGRMTVATQLSVAYVKYEEDYMPQDWTLTDSTKTVLGYICQQAECDYKGRHYVAWFTPDIPVGDGPWKFNGLPGLILEVYDSKGYYRFTAEGIRQNGVRPLRFYEFHDYGNVSLESFVKAKKKERTITSAKMGNVGISGLSTGKNDKPLPGGLEILR